MKVRRHSSVSPGKLAELFAYDPLTGILKWKISRSNRVRVGQVAGSVQTNHKGKAYESKYLRVRLGEGFYLVHRIAFALMTGQWPDQQIDHRDGDGTNNRWKNLRFSNRSQNMGNRDRNRSRVRDLPKGVQFHNRDNLYYARLAGKTIGYFKTVSAAKAAYDDAATKYYGEFAKS